MNPQVKVNHNVGNTIEIPNLLDIRAVTYLSANANTGATALPVDNAIDFTSGSTILLLVSSLGAENAEILSSVSHSNTSFTVPASTMPHNRGDSVNQIAYDQILIQKSTTINGAYSTLATLTFQVTSFFTTFFDTAGLSTDYYKVQWRNSVTGEVSELSDSISATSFSEDSAGSLISSVLESMGISKGDKNINTQFMLGRLNDARTLVKGKLFGIRHSWNQQFEYPIKILAGTNYVDLPSDIDFNQTDRSLLSARLQIDNIISPYNLQYIDKRSWNNLQYSSIGSRNVGQVSIAGTSIVLESTGDLPASGSLFVATTDFNQTIMQISYTANNKTTNTLTGVTGVTRIIPIGTQIWLRPILNQPVYYTVYDDKIVFDRVVPDSMQGNNLYIDYYKKFSPITSISDVLDEPYREIYKSFLRYAVKYRKDTSTPKTDPDYKEFEELIESLFNNLYTGQGSVIITN